MNLQDSSVYNALKNADLLARCGKPLAFESSCRLLQVRSWQEAQRLCSEDPWCNTTLGIANQLRTWLYVFSPGIIEQWNETVVPRCLEAFDKTAAELSRRCVDDNALSERVYNCIRWDLTLCLIEDYCRVEGMPTFACDTLLPVYLNGHFPCGWSGTEFPNGQMTLY